MTEIKSKPMIDSTSSTVSDISAVHAQRAAEIQFEKWKRVCAQTIIAFRDEQCEIHSYLIWYERLLTNYVNKRPIIPNTQIDQEEVNAFVLDDFLETSMTALMKREHIHWNTDYNNADLISNCCRLLVAIAVPLIKEDHPLSWSIIYHCLHAGIPFFRTFGLDWREKRGYELSNEEKEELSEWRDTEVVEGAYVEYLFKNRWKYGQIKKIISYQHPETGAKNRRMAIQPQMPDIWPMYVRSRHDQAQNRLVFTESIILDDNTVGQIAKPLSKSVEQIPHMTEWRKQLTADKDAEEKYRKCDVLDSVRKWYTCTILEESQAMNKLKIRYDGWSQRYDEWVGRDEKKVQPYMSHAKGGRETQGVLGDMDDLKGWEDDEDPEDCYAVYRGKMNEHSFHLVDILNEFGRCGGFDALIARLASREPNIPVRNLRHIISPLSKCYQLYSKRVAADIIPKIHKLTFETLESLSEMELRDLQKEYLERIVGSVEVFLRRFEIPDHIEDNTTRSAKQTHQRAQATLEQLNRGIQSNAIWGYAEMLNFDPDVILSLPENIRNDIIPPDLQQEVNRHLNQYRTLVAQRDEQQQQLQQIQLEQEHAAAVSEEQEEVSVPDDEAKTEIKEDDIGIYTAGLQTHKIHEICETFQLRMALRRLKCGTIERRVDAVQFIDDICSRTRRYGNHYGRKHVRFITPDYLMKWIEDNKLLELLFGDESHPEVMEKTANILQFVCRESGLTRHHLESIWTSLERAAAKQIEGENESRILCELIENLRSLLQSENIDFLFSKFDEMDPSTLTKYHLKLMSALSKNETTMQWLTIPQTVLRALWDPVGDDSKPEEKQTMDDEHDSSGISNKEENVQLQQSLIATADHKVGKAQLNLVDGANTEASNENQSAAVTEEQDQAHATGGRDANTTNASTWVASVQSAAPPPSAAPLPTNTSPVIAAPLPIGCDPAVFAALPADMQQEILREQQAQPVNPVGTDIMISKSRTLTKKIKAREELTLKQFSETTTLTELFWDGHCRSDLGHYQHIPSEIRAQIMEYCDFYVLRVGYKIRNPDPFTNDKMVDHDDRKWKVSILRFNEDMTTSSFAEYLESKQVRHTFYGHHPQSDQDALLWSTGKQVDFLVIRSAKVSGASDSEYRKLIDLKNTESKREAKEKVKEPEYVGLSPDRRPWWML